MFPTVEELQGKMMGGYRLERVIGKGGMSTVFLGKPLVPSQREVAIKVFMPPVQLSSAERQEARQRFAREALMLRTRLHHPHILPVILSGEDEASGYAFLITPYIDGGTLTTRIQAGGLPFAEAIHYISQIAEALDYAHSHNIIHRDIKPANILIDTQNNLYLADFGLIKLVDQSFTTLTEIGRVVGTPEYMAPEQARGETITKAVDIYGLGIIAYLLLTGHLPYPIASTANMLVQVIARPPLPPRSFRPDLPEPAEAVLLCALSKDPQARFGWADAFVKALIMGIRGQWPPSLPAPLSVESLPRETLLPLPHQASNTPQKQESSTHPVATTSRETRRSRRTLFITTATLLLLLSSGMLFARNIFSPSGKLSSSSPAPTQEHHMTTISYQLTAQSTAVTNQQLQPTPEPEAALPLAPTGQNMVTVQVTPMQQQSTPPPVVQPTPPMPSASTKPTVTVVASGSGSATPPPSGNTGKPAMAVLYLTPSFQTLPYCGANSTVNFTMQNQGTVRTRWFLYTNPEEYLVSPTFGVLKPQESVKFTVSGPAVTGFVIIRWIDDNGNNGDVDFYTNC